MFAAEQLPDVGGEWQASLFALGDPSVDPELPGLTRTWLDDHSWVDHLPRWMHGSDTVFAELVARLPWEQPAVVMYDRVVDTPRLVWWWHEDVDPPSALPLLVLEDVRRALTLRYGVRFRGIGCNYYRTGQDSVAWHGDRERHGFVEPIVAIVSVGAPRPFLLRPRGGGASVQFRLGQGDLLVMGGACQHAWEHTVPKVAQAGPRISITFRHGPATPPRPPGDPDLADARRRHPAGATRSPG